MPRQRPHEALRAALGAGLALSLSAGLLVVLSAWRGDIASFLLIAPLGASAFLLFAIPNSPLAQPWSRSEEHTSELQSLMRISYAVFCLKKKKKQMNTIHSTAQQQKTT